MTRIVAEGRLAVGMQLHIQSQSTLYAEPWESDCGAPELAALATAADRSGFFYVAVCDHVALPREPAERMSTTWYDPFTTLGWLAGITENVRLLSHVLVAGYRPPLVTAKAFMTLDELSEGRAVLGIGVGHVEGEFAALGADYAGRGTVADEVIDVVRAAFADEFVTHDGDRFAFEDVGLAPRPRQESLPIWVGGSSKPAMRRAAERGDGWLPQGTPPDQMPASIEYIREHRAATRGDEPIDIGAFAAPMYVGDPEWDVGRWTLSGSADRLAEHLTGFATMGVTNAQIRLRSRSHTELVDQIEAFGAEVLPLLD